MKLAMTTSIFSVLCSFGAIVFAETVDIKDAGSGTDAATTIEISKGGKKKCEAVWEIHNGSAELEGDPMAMSKEAKDAWKKVCNDWKKEFRQDNKDNKILSVNCGNTSCTNEKNGTVCRSKAEYTIKTRLDM